MMWEHPVYENKRYGVNAMWDAMDHWHPAVDKETYLANVKALELMMPEFADQVRSRLIDHGEPGHAMDTAKLYQWMVWAVSRDGTVSKTAWPAGWVSADGIPNVRLEPNGDVKDLPRLRELAAEYGWPVFRAWRFHYDPSNESNPGSLDLPSSFVLVRV